MITKQCFIYGKWTDTIFGTEDLNLSTTEFESVAIDLSQFIDKKVSDRVYLVTLADLVLNKKFWKK